MKKNGQIATDVFLQETDHPRSSPCVWLCRRNRIHTCLCGPQWCIHSDTFSIWNPMRQVENTNEQIATDVFWRKQITTGALPVCDSAVETECTRVCVVHSDVFIPIHFLFKTPMRQVENATATCETRMDPWITFRKLMLLLHTKQVNNLWSKGNMNM